MKQDITIPKNIVCLSHLRWDFVYQRPQHLLSRFSKQNVVYFFEEPIFQKGENNYLATSKRDNDLNILTPHLQEGSTKEDVIKALADLFDQFIANLNLEETLFWYYTPMSLQFTEKHKPKLVVYDCMDELSAFKFADPNIINFEKKLLAKADLVFTGGQSLYEAKKKYHSNIFPYPSSIDRDHFRQATNVLEAADQALIKGPKIGFFGVIDERFDIELIRKIAEQKPDWQLILIGPVVKINPDDLPKNANIHYLGQKCYQDLPGYLAGWDVALIPFMLNESTRFISPTKTPEYLSAHIPVVSTAIRDVVNPYGLKKLVHIAADANDFIEAIKIELSNSDHAEWLEKIDQQLKEMSWDKTFSSMAEQIKNTIISSQKISIAS